MFLVLVTALIAVCGADKLDRAYLPPASASSAGGTAGSLQTPFRTFNQGLGGLPKGSYSNDFEGVVVDAAAPGTRASGGEETGLGAPRVVYGSTDSKVGEAAFLADTPFQRVAINSGFNTQGTFGANNLPQNFQSRPERIQSSRDRVSNTVKYENEVSPEKFNYAFETDNGIIAEEVGIEVDGVKAQGGFSYTGDDGQVYRLTYTADEDGYRPKGDHLPTPPPIPAEILESLEKNAQDEAAGIVDDGSYNAQKYNTGDDYTKNDNGQYDGSRPIQLGARPQSNVGSGSFVSSNNQGFVRPNSQQFGSTSSLDSSKSKPSNGNYYGAAIAGSPGQNGEGISGQNGDGSNLGYSGSPGQNAFGFGATSQNQYLPPANVFNSNRKPANNGFQGTQSNVQNGFPTFSSPSNNDSGFNKKQSTGTPVFIPLSQQKLQEDKPKRPQSNSPVFGKPTIIDSTLSIKDPFAKRPSNNRFTQNQQPNQKPQAIGGSFEVVSGNVYSSNKEYLPPRQQSNKPNQNIGNQRFPGTGYGAQPNQQNYSPNSPSASAFASVSKPSSGFQTSQQYNSQNIPQKTGNNLFGQVNQNSNNKPFNQGQSSTNLPNVPSFNNSPESQYQYRPLTFASQSPNSKPQSGLTNPLVSNFGGNINPSPIPVTGGSDSSKTPGSFGLNSFSQQPSNSFSGQNTFNANQFLQASPTQPTSFATTVSDQTVNPNFQNIPNLGPSGNLGSQPQPSPSTVNEQFSFSTPRPSTQNFNQYNQQQGADDSYFYNKPSKPFNSPTPRPDSSAFPSTSFDQSFNKVTQTPFGSKPQLSGSTSSIFKPQDAPDTTRYPSTPGAVSPTQPTEQDGQNSNIFQTQFNKVTQASTSSFPSSAPTTSAFTGNQFGNTKPFQPASQSNKEIQNTQQGLSPRPQQQYGGEIYEYNKPPQSLPTPQKTPPSGQFGSITTPQITQSPASATYTPSAQFGSQSPQQFDQNPQSSLSQQNLAFNTNGPAQSQQKPGIFGSQPSNLGQGPQKIQGASKFPPAYNNQGSPCCKELGSSQSSQREQGAVPQFTNQFKPDGEFGLSQGTKPGQSVSSFAGVGESFGGSRKPPSFDKDGYHY